MGGAFGGFRRAVGDLLALPAVAALRGGGDVGAGDGVGFGAAGTVVGADGPESVVVLVADRVERRRLGAGVAVAAAGEVRGADGVGGGAGGLGLRLHADRLGGEPGDELGVRADVGGVQARALARAV